MKLRIVHVVPDDKFIDGAISLFETDKRVENKYIYLGETCTFKYIKSDKVQIISENNAAEIINIFDVVVIHSLPAIPLDILFRLNERLKVVWLAWGYDIYEKPYDFVKIKLFARLTKVYITPGLLLSRFLGRKQNQDLGLLKNKEDILSHIDYFSGVFPYEVDLMKKNNHSFHAVGLDFYYGSSTFFIPEVPDTNIVHGKPNLIIGNSGNPTGNHLDVLKTISKVDLDSDMKIIIPLSYGGSEKYKNAIEAKAKKIAPNGVISLREYLPFSEYQDMIRSCKSAIFAHERQQASDNIFLQLLNGARVFLSETSLAYDYLKNLGFVVFSYQKDISLINKELDDSEILTNRRLLSANYSSSRLIKRVKDINSILIEDI